MKDNATFMNTVHRTYYYYYFFIKRSLLHKYITCLQSGKDGKQPWNLRLNGMCF